MAIFEPWVPERFLQNSGPFPKLPRIFTVKEGLSTQRPIRYYLKLNDSKHTILAIINFIFTRNVTWGNVTLKLPKFKKFLFFSNAQWSEFQNSAY